jgi:prevent-host-death family protein
MCYMKTSSQVEVRELRQNLSVYLARVMAGETLEVTDRGQSVALFTPLNAGESVLERLAREGKLTPATADLLALPRRHKAPSRRWASRELLHQLADRKL